MGPTGANAGLGAAEAAAVVPAAPSSTSSILAGPLVPAAAAVPGELLNRLPNRPGVDPAVFSDIL